MKYLIIPILLIFILIPITAQSNIEDFVKEGVQYHDAGDFDKAIRTYKKALKIAPKSALVNYEISLSYFEKGEYKKAIKYSDIILKQKKDFMLQAYMTKGSALDNLGKTKESIKLFKKAIKNSYDHYLMHYNLSLNYFKLNNFDSAEESLLKAIELNPNHSSSHLMLASVHHQKGNPVQSILASHYFLLLEPNSKRSKEAYKMLHQNFSGQVSKDNKNPNTINISMSPNESPFSAAELMISMLEASKQLKENSKKSDDELFIKHTKTFFGILGGMNKDQDDDIWWTFYIPFFSNLADTEHLETYCKYISQSENVNSQTWLGTNKAKLESFGRWLKNN